MEDQKTRHVATTPIAQFDELFNFTCERIGARKIDAVAFAMGYSPSAIYGWRKQGFAPLSGMMALRGVVAEIDAGEKRPTLSLEQVADLLVLATRHSADKGLTRALIALLPQ